MRIRQLGVQSVLHFQDFQLDFGQEHGGLHVIYGPNEAGKSTLLKLLVDLMFGGKLEDSALDMYDARHSRIYGVLEQGTSPDKDILRAMAANLEQAATSEHGLQAAPDGTLEAHGGLSIWRRRKWSSLFLFDNTDSELPEDVLAPFLSGFDKERYTLLFGFDHDRLRAGGDSLLESGGHAGISLFEAGGGIQFLQATLQALTARVDERVDVSFRKTSAKLLNAAWNRYKEYADKSRKTGLRGEEWQRDREEIARLELEIANLRKGKGDLSAELAKLTRIKRVRQTVMDLKDARKLRTAFDSSRGLSLDEAAQLVSVVDQAEALERTLTEQRTEEGERQAKLLAIHVDKSVLALQSEVAKGMEGVGQYEEYSRELPQLSARLESERGQALDLLRALNPRLAFEDAESLRIPYTTELEIRKLTEQSLEQARLGQEEQRRIAELRLEKQKLLKELEEIGPIPDTSRLKVVWEEFQSLPDLESELAKQKAEWAERRASAQAKLAGQAIWSGSLEGISSLQLPLVETISQFAERFNRLDRDSERAENDLYKLNEELTVCREDMKSLEVGGVIPVEADLKEARTAREQGWALIKDVWLNSSVDEERLERYAGEIGLPKAYEAAVERADSISDVMRRDSQKSARRAQLLLTEERLLRSIEQAQERLQSLRENHEQLEQEWVSLWTSSQMLVRTPSEMKEWMTGVYRPLVEELQALNTMRRTIGRLTTDIDAWVIQFRNLLRDLPGRAELTSGFEEATLKRLKGIASQVLATAEQRALLHSKTRQRDVEIENKILAGLESLKTIEEKKQSVATSWNVLCEQYAHLPGDLELAGAYLDKLRGLFEGMREFTRLETEIQHKESVTSKFEEFAIGLSERLRESDEGTMEARRDPAGFVRTLQGRVREALQAEKSAQEQAREIERVQSLMKATTATFEEAKSTTSRNLEIYGCSDVASLLALAEDAKQIQAAEHRVSELEEQLRRSGDGLSLQELEAEVEGAPLPDQIEARLQVVQDEMQDCDRVMEARNKELWEVKARFDALDGQNADAAHALQQAEIELGDVDRLWNEVLRLELARRLLQRAIDDFRRQNESAVLHRAEELFRRLTIGRYQELSVQYDGSTPYLEARDVDGAKRRVHQMSDGTRDQLYLALRLVFVEQHARSGHSMPLIMDDILVHYDDARSQATLEILAELASSVQVLYFTHHRSIVDTVATMDSNSNSYSNDAKHALSRGRISVHDITRQAL